MQFWVLQQLIGGWMFLAGLDTAAAANAEMDPFQPPDECSAVTEEGANRHRGLPHLFRSFGQAAIGMVPVSAG